MQLLLIPKRETTKIMVMLMISFNAINEAKATIDGKNYNLIVNTEKKQSY